MKFKVTYFWKSCIIEAASAFDAWAKAKIILALSDSTSANDVKIEQI